MVESCFRLVKLGALAHAAEAAERVTAVCMH
jgi:hypothetical protein